MPVPPPLPRFRTVPWAPVCVAVMAETVESCFALARDALRRGSLVELRLDALEDPWRALDQLGTLHAEQPGAQLLATCRRVAGGGGFRGEAQEQLRLLERCAAAGCTLVDVEEETLQAITQEELARFAASLEQHGCGWVASAHNFVAAEDPETVFQRLLRLTIAAAPALFKVVNTAGRLADSLPMLRFVENAKKRGHTVTGLCMGEMGLPSRVLALRAGAPFTFAALEGATPTAPGQLSRSALLDEYHVDRLTERTRIYGVVGNPIGHSLSPAMHNAAFRAAGIDAVYLPLLTREATDLLRLARELPLEGLSVTMPFKVDMLPLLDSADALARAIGAANTVIRTPEGSLHGTNTDAAAVVEPLRQRIALAGTRVLLVGSGGAARAAAFGLAAAGARLSIFSRNRQAAADLARECGAQAVCAEETPGHAVIVHATPAGMAGMPEHELAVPLPALAEAALLFEMVYRPRKTALVRTAQERGIEVIDGIEMFVHQGARQWSLWTGQEAPLAVMRAAVEQIG